ncbi:hypothetical protein CHELA1G11_12006 [Hyphomicrobiales bacterium]|nr:hypothetical protein CHELA1G11_12006 [Hyphomicrobiales bacterium]CAH1663947.1 hypothetical protein CHELA1G2_12306 [Hyphomicrobiales bacterium]
MTNKADKPGLRIKVAASGEVRRQPLKRPKDRELRLKQDRKALRETREAEAAKSDISQVWDRAERRDAAESAEQSRADDLQRWREERKQEARAKAAKKPRKRKSTPSDDLGERLFGVDPKAGYEGKIPVIEQITRRTAQGFRVPDGFRNIRSNPVETMVRRGQCSPRQHQAAVQFGEDYDAAVRQLKGMSWEVPVQGGGYREMSVAALDAVTTLKRIERLIGPLCFSVLVLVVGHGNTITDLVRLKIAPDRYRAGSLLGAALDGACVVYGLASQSAMITAVYHDPVIQALRSA